MQFIGRPRTRHRQTIGGPVADCLQSHRTLADWRLTSKQIMSTRLADLWQTMREQAADSWRTMRKALNLPLAE